MLFSMNRRCQRMVSPMVQWLLVIIFTFTLSLRHSEAKPCDVKISVTTLNKIKEQRPTVDLNVYVSMKGKLDANKLILAALGGHPYFPFYDKAFLDKWMKTQHLCLENNVSPGNALWQVHIERAIIDRLADQEAKDMDVIKHLNQIALLLKEVGSSWDEVASIAKCVGHDLDNIQGFISLRLDHDAKQRILQACGNMYEEIGWIRIAHINNEQPYDTKYYLDRFLSRSVENQMRAINAGFSHYKSWFFSHFSNSDSSFASSVIITIIEKALSAAFKEASPFFAVGAAVFKELLKSDPTKNIRNSVQHILDSEIEMNKVGDALFDKIYKNSEFFQKYYSTAVELNELTRGNASRQLQDDLTCATISYMNVIGISSPNAEIRQNISRIFLYNTIYATLINLPRNGTIAGHQTVEFEGRTFLLDNDQTSSTLQTQADIETDFLMNPKDIETPCKKWKSLTPLIGLDMGRYYKTKCAAASSYEN